MVEKIKNGPRYLPGDTLPAVDVERMVRVNHAGEYGAKRIYEGQLAIMRSGPKAEIIRHMAEQEQLHLDYFSGQLVKRRVRPTALMPLWHVAGFVLGAGTALIGEKAAMACTVAVEEVIDEHYAKQRDRLAEDEGALKQAIERFRQEEVEHRDIGLDNGAEQAPAYPLLSDAIKKASKLAIWIAERV